MTVKELMKIIADKGLTAKTKGFTEKRELIELLRDTRKSKSPTPKKVGSPRDTRKSKSPTPKKVGSPRNKTIKIDPDEKKLQELIQTHERLNQSIKELEQIINDVKAEKNISIVSDANNELKRQKLELKQIEKEIHKITGTKFSILNEISHLFSRLTLRK
jgi:uncharacterized protein (UPF0147 family)